MLQLKLTHIQSISHLHVRVEIIFHVNKMSDMDRLCALGGAMCRMALGPAVGGAGKRKQQDENETQEEKRLKQGVHFVYLGVANAYEIESTIEKHKKCTELFDKNITKAQKKTERHMCKLLRLYQPAWVYTNKNGSASQLQLTMVHDTKDDIYTFHTPWYGTGALLFFGYHVKAKIVLHYFYFGIPNEKEDKEKFPPYMTMYFLCVLADILNVPIHIPEDVSAPKSLIFNEKERKWELEYVSYYGRYGFYTNEAGQTVRDPCPKPVRDWIKQNCGNNYNAEECMKRLRGQELAQDDEIPRQCFLETTQNVLAIADLNVEKSARFYADDNKSIETRKDGPVPEYWPNGNGTLVVYDEHGKPTRYKGSFEATDTNPRGFKGNTITMLDGTTIREIDLVVKPGEDRGFQVLNMLFEPQEYSDKAGIHFLHKGSNSSDGSTMLFELEYEVTLTKNKRISNFRQMTPTKKRRIRNFRIKKLRPGAPTERYSTTDAKYDEIINSIEGGTIINIGEADFWKGALENLNFDNWLWVPSEGIFEGWVEKGLYFIGRPGQHTLMFESTYNSTSKLVVQFRYEVNDDKGASEFLNAKIHRVINCIIGAVEIGDEALGNDIANIKETRIITADEYRNLIPKPRSNLAIQAAKKCRVRS